MPKKRFQPEEVIGKLRHADVLHGQGKKIAEVVSRARRYGRHLLPLAPGVRWDFSV